MNASVDPRSRIAPRDVGLRRGRRGTSTPPTSTAAPQASRRRCSTPPTRSRASACWSSRAARAARASPPRPRRPRRRGRGLRRRPGHDGHRRAAGSRAWARRRAPADPRPGGIDEPDGAYDVVLCREGLMFAADPARAAASAPRAARGRPGRRSRSGARGRATPGSAWCWTPRRRPSATRCRRRAAPARSRWRTATASPPCSPTPGSPTSPSRRCATPLQAALVDEWWQRPRRAWPARSSASSRGSPGSARSAMRGPRGGSRVALRLARRASPSPGVTLVASARA